MPLSLETFSDAQLRAFLKQVRTHDFLSFLQGCRPADVERQLALLSPHSAAFVRAALPAAGNGNPARAEHLLNRIAGGSTACIFCLILAGEAPASFIIRDENVAAFMDLYPVTPGHLLIIPLRHHTFLEEIDSDVAAHIMRAAHRIGRAVLASDLGCDGFNLFLANGGAAGQDVFHVHLHVLPRYHADGFGFRFPSHYPREADRDFLDERAAHLREVLARADG
ncbi:MAG: HIT family protein [Anaerolineae bacterium]|nr:HIT family protein [Anaerolineae bacterium]